MSPRAGWVASGWRRARMSAAITASALSRRAGLAPRSSAPVGAALRPAAGREDGGGRGYPPPGYEPGFSSALRLRRWLAHAARLEVSGGGDPYEAPATPAGGTRPARASRGAPSLAGLAPMH